ncbi:MAG: hypothetical protein LHW56_09060 [Candidatus Cloacimonetes bacterium]|nr:hypothetical protein [Candidatus Cloacimonadota bacterium]MDY0173040.1 hypothetical protein [Candidatus Cloacimonadaceae bacterium]
MKKILVITILVLAGLTLVGCNSASKKIDTYLNGLELSVANDEKSLDAGESILVIPTDVENKYKADLAIGVDQYMILTKGNPEQQRKFADIKNRIDVLQSRLPIVAEEIAEEVNPNAPNTPSTPNKPYVPPVTKPTEPTKPVENSIDKLLNTYETIIVTYENAADSGKLGMKDMAKITTDLSELKKKTDGVEMTDAQSGRLGNLTVRFTKVLKKASSKPKK